MVREDGHDGRDYDDVREDGDAEDSGDYRHVRGDGHDGGDVEVLPCLLQPLRLALLPGKEHVLTG